MTSTRSAREVHQKKFRDHRLVQRWQDGYREAISGGVSIRLPYGEQGNFISDSTAAMSYDMMLKQGERLMVSVDAPGAVFSQLRSGNAILVESDSLGTVQFTAQRTGAHRLIVQPGMVTNGLFRLKVERDASLSFPVAGKGNASIQSFWADERDGGKRRHEGIDIFAKRGTPVVAVADGFITYTGERGLGGKQVWQRTGLFGHSIYYAHLDAVTVAGGQRVRTGDTLGFVGNTGNAKHTAPHLHFGIYTASGAVDPLPFVYRHKPISISDFKVFSKTAIKVKTARANIRKSPDVAGEVIAQAPRSARLLVMGQSRDWLHVRSDDGRRGFVHRSVVSAVN